MPRAMTPMLLLASQILATCALSLPSGPGLRVDPLPANVAAPCAHPQEALGLGDWKIIAGWLGSELIKCGAKLRADVTAYNAIAAAVNKTGQH